MTRLFADLTPLRVSAPYRRLWSALGIANVGQQMTSVAVGLQVWDITRSSLMVGLVGLFQLVPLVGFGLYGGTLSDAFDRRKVGVVSAAGLWACSMAFLAQSLLQWNEVSVLYLVVAVQSAFFAVGNPARQAIIPRIVPAELLPAANALGMITWNVGFTLGPVLGGLLVAFTGTVTSAYAVDVVAFAVVLWAMLRLPSLPPIVDARDRATARRLGRREGGLRLPEGQAQPADDLLPGHRRHGVRHAARAVPGDRRPVVRRDDGRHRAGPRAALGGAGGRGAHVGGAVRAARDGCGCRAGRSSSRSSCGARRSPRSGSCGWLPLALLLLALAGAADNVSAVFRTTILQAATPDEYRGRLQGVFTVVVAGGPRLGDVEAGVVAALAGEAFSVVSGGVLCVIGVDRAWRRSSPGSSGTTRATRCPDSGSRLVVLADAVRATRCGSFPNDEMYESLGFRECLPYHDYPADLVTHLRFMEKSLAVDRPIGPVGSGDVESCGKREL